MVKAIFGAPIADVVGGNPLLYNNVNREDHICLLPATEYLASGHHD